MNINHILKYNKRPYSLKLNVDSHRPAEPHFLNAGVSLLFNVLACGETCNVGIEREFGWGTFKALNSMACARSTLNSESLKYIEEIWDPCFV